MLRGNSSYIYDGNWKMQMENGCDGYHVSTVHWNYAATMDRRKVDGHQGGGCEQLEQVGSRRVRLRPRPYSLVDQDDEPGSAGRFINTAMKSRRVCGEAKGRISSSTRRATCACIRTCS